MCVYERVVNNPRVAIQSTTVLRTRERKTTSMDHFDCLRIIRTVLGFRAGFSLFNNTMPQCVCLSLFYVDTQHSSLSRSLSLSVCLSVCVCRVSSNIGRERDVIGRVKRWKSKRNNPIDKTLYVSRLSIELSSFGVHFSYSALYTTEKI